MTEKEQRQWQKIRSRLGLMSRKQLHKLVKLSRRELESRWQFDEALKKWKAGGYRGLSNFMAGVTWAMACRQSLRQSKGHAPPGGQRAQSGQMWLPAELLYAVRHQVKDRGWHPITATSARVVLDNLQAEESAARVAAHHGDSLRAVKFVIPYARAEARRQIQIPVDDRFDFYDLEMGGEA